MPTAPVLAAPAVWWQALTWALILLAAGYAVLIGVRVGTLMHEDSLVNQLVADPHSVDPATFRNFVAFVRSLDQVYNVLLFVYLGAYLLWIVTVGRVVTRLGHDRRVVLRHWTYIVWRVTLIPVLLLAIVLHPDPLPDPTDRGAFRDALIGLNQNLIAYSLARLVTLGLFIAAVVVIWNRVRMAARPPA